MAGCRTRVRKKSKPTPPPVISPRKGIAEIRAIADRVLLSRPEVTNTELSDNIGRSLFYHASLAPELENEEWLVLHSQSISDEDLMKRNRQFSSTISAEIPPSDSENEMTVLEPDISPSVVVDSCNVTPIQFRRIPDSDPEADFEVSDLDHSS